MKDVWDTAIAYCKLYESTNVNDDLYTEKLDWFKQSEKPEVVLVATDNPELIKIIIAWTSLAVKRADKLTELKSDTENEV